MAALRFSGETDGFELAGPGEARGGAGEGPTTRWGDGAPSVASYAPRCSGDVNVSCAIVICVKRRCNPAL
jgi:hypothetical protein